MSAQIPVKIEDINAKWFTEILGETVVESTFNLKLNANEGTGFCSTMVRAEFETKPGHTQSVILKFPPADGESREILLKDKFDQTEIFSYQILIPELLKDMPDLKNYICEVIYSEIQEVPAYNSVIVLKDLKPEGYYVVTTASDLQCRHFNEGLDFLIKLHVSSKCLESRINSSIVSAYSWFPKCYNKIKSSEENSTQEFPSMYQFFPAGYPAIYKVLARNQHGVRILPSMRKIEENAPGIFRAIINAGQDFPSLIHGDLWTHNILVKDEVGFPIKVIDWQLVGYTDPAYDLVIFLLFCLPLSNLTVDGITEAAKKYYTEYSALMKKRGLNVERSSEEFLKFFQTYGLSFGFIIVMGSPPLQSEAESEPKFHKIFDLFIGLKIPEFMLSLVGV